MKKYMQEYILRKEKLFNQFNIAVDQYRSPEELGAIAEAFMLENKKEFIYLNISLDSLLSWYYTSGVNHS